MSAPDTPGVNSESTSVMETGDPLLKTEELTKRFGGFTAIDDINFSVAEGELRCLIGPNGAGKSTLMQLITGRHTATEGHIYYKDHEITGLDPHERINLGIGIKFQVPSVFGHLTAFENMRLPLQRVPHGDSLTTAVNDALERVGLVDQRDIVADELPHGQQQRLEIGMAAALSPDLLLLDEPVAGLSTEERNGIAELIETLNDAGIAFVVVEHDIEFVARIAHEVTVLHHGAVFREGPIEAIRDDTDVRRIYLGGE